MTWTQTSKYSLESDGWRIAKFMIGENRARYLVFDKQNNLYAVFDTSDEAKVYCEEYRKAA